MTMHFLPSLTPRTIQFPKNGQFLSSTAFHIENGIRLLTIGTTQLILHVHWQKLAVNSQPVSLSLREYCLIAGFLLVDQGSLCTQEGCFLVSYRHTSDLQMEAAIPNRQLLRKHISNLNSKLAEFGLRLLSFDRGYVLTVASSSTALHGRADAASSR